MHYTQHCTSKFPASKFQSLQSTESRRPHTSRTLCRTTALVRPEPSPLCTGTSPLHSKQHSNTKAHSFQLVFQSHVHSNSSRRCVNSKRRIALIRSNCNVPSAQHRLHTHTNWSTIPRTTFTTSRPFTGQSLFLRDKRRRSTSAKLHQRAVANSSDAGQLAPKPVDVFGPSAPRVRLAACFFRCPSRRRRGFAVCARLLRTPLRLVRRSDSV